MCYRQPLLHAPLPPLVLDGCVRRPILSSSLSSMRPVLFWRCGRVDMRSNTASSPPVARAAATQGVEIWPRSAYHTLLIAGATRDDLSNIFLGQVLETVLPCSSPSAPRQARHVGPAVRGRRAHPWYLHCWQGWRRCRCCPAPCRAATTWSEVKHQMEGSDLEPLVLRHPAAPAEQHAQSVFEATCP